MEMFQKTLLRVSFFGGGGRRYLVTYSCDNIQLLHQLWQLCIQMWSYTLLVSSCFMQRFNRRIVNPISLFSPPYKSKHQAPSANMKSHSIDSLPMKLSAYLCIQTANTVLGSDFPNIAFCSDTVLLLRPMIKT